MDLGQTVAAGGTAAIALIVLWVVLFNGLVIWITYTIIWRAVRRGLREYYRDAPNGRPSRNGLASSSASPEPLRRESGPRDW